MGFEGHKTVLSTDNSSLVHTCIPLHLIYPPLHGWSHRHNLHQWEVVVVNEYLSTQRLQVVVAQTPIEKRGWRTLHAMSYYLLGMWKCTSDIIPANVVIGWCQSYSLWYCINYLYYVECNVIMNFPGRWQSIINWVMSQLPVISMQNYVHIYNYVRTCTYTYELIFFLVPTHSKTLPSPTTPGRDCPTHGTL